MGCEVTTLLLTLMCVLVLANESCDPHTLVQYQLTFQGFWTRARFPKVYPELRPKAEWSSLIGRSHSSSYNLFSKGALVNSKLQTFVEYGDSTKLDGEGQGNSLILDSFTSQPILSGYGVSESRFFCDSNRHKVSFAVKIVPSPDWFVGIDSYSLCKNGEWVDSGQFDLSPLDAGSQQGYTFSSPRWRSDPQEMIYQITSSYPNHTADAFYYPNMKALPPIATATFSRIRSYQAHEAIKSTADPSKLRTQDHTDVIENIQGQKSTVMVKPPVPHSTRNGTIPSPHTTIHQTTTPTSTSVAPTTRETTPTLTTSVESSSTQTGQNQTTPSAEATLKWRILELLGGMTKTRKQSTASPTVAASTTTTATTEPSKWFGWSTTHPTPKRVYMSQPSWSDVDDDEDTDPKETEGSGIVVEDTYRRIASTYQQPMQVETTAITPEEYQSNKILPPDDEYDSLFEAKACLVSGWTEWTACSKTCGYGMKSRTREITKWTGNVVCPELYMELLCGSMKKCQWNHFSLKFNSTQSLFGNQKRIRMKKVNSDGSKANSTGALTGHSGSFRRRYRIGKSS